MLHYLMYEKQIEKNKIDITWDYFTKVYENRGRRYLQIFLLCLTFILSLLLSMAIGRCPLSTGVPIILVLIAGEFYYLYKYRKLNKGLGRVHKFILEELDKLNK